MPKIPAPRKPAKVKTCASTGCKRPLDHKGRCGEMTKAEQAALATVATTTKKKPIAQAVKEVAKDPRTKEIAESIPKTQKKKCPGCDKAYTARPSGLLPPHKFNGEPCTMKAPEPVKKKSPTKGKKYLCPVPEKDGCGRMVGVMPTGLLAKHIRTDGTPCPGSDLKPGSPLPKVKKVAPLDPKAKPKSRPIHSREDRSEYHRTPALAKSRKKAEELAEICAQYGWEPTYREHDETVELTMTRGVESIYIYWEAGVCAGERITYSVEDYTTKLRNASAVKMRAAVEPKTTVAEVYRKMEHRTASSKRMKALNEEKVLNEKARKNPAVTLGQTLIKETDEKISAMVAGKWIGWRNRITGNEETGMAPKDPRKITLKDPRLIEGAKLPEIEGDRWITFSDPDYGARTLMLSCLLRIQSKAMRRRTNVHSGDEEEEAPTKKKAKAKA